MFIFVLNRGKVLTRRREFGISDPEHGPGYWLHVTHGFVQAPIINGTALAGVIRQEPHVILSEFHQSASAVVVCADCPDGGARILHILAQEIDLDERTCAWVRQEYVLEAAQDPRQYSRMGRLYIQRHFAAYVKAVFGFIESILEGWRLSALAMERQRAAPGTRAQL